MRLTLFFISIFFSCGLLNSQIVWLNDKINLQAEASDTKAEAVFKFKNEGTYSVTITGISSNCGCTTAEIDKKVYNPGESGEIKAILDFGFKTGLQTEEIIIELDDPSNPNKNLLFNVDIPQLLKISPKRIYWLKSKPLEERSVLIEATGTEKFIITSIISGNPNINLFLNPVKDGKLYRLVIKPTGPLSSDYFKMLSSGHHKIRFNVKLPEEIHKSYFIPARIY